MSFDQNGVNENPFVEFIERYDGNTPLLVREVFDAEPDEWQVGVMAAYDRRVRRISIRSGHGVGKTTVLAWIICSHILTRYPQKTVCTAPTSSQLFDALAAEVKAWLNKLPPILRALFDIKTDRIELVTAPEESFISFRTSRPETPEALAGVHSEHVLLIGDEASGIPEQVFEAAAGSMSGHNATTILAGNPVRTSGTFYDTHHRLKGEWETFHVSCVDSPRVTPDFVEEMRKKYGERSNAFRVRVLGEFPLADDDTVIPYELAAGASTRDVTPMLVRPVWGLDCARFGSDRTALAKRRGNVLLEPVKSKYGLDTMQVVGWVLDEWRSTPYELRPEEILVDVIGIGAGVCDRLRELGLPARGINVSESPALKDRFLNLRAELWWAVREWLQGRMVRLPDDELIGELTAVKYTFTSSGRIQIESKKDMKARGLPSPDLADAFVLTFAGQAAVATHGAAGNSSWGKPLKRRIRGIV